MASKMEPLFQGLFEGQVKTHEVGKFKLIMMRLHIPSQPAQVLEKTMKILYDEYF